MTSWSEFKIAVLALVLVMLQSSILHWVLPAQAVPNLMIPVVVYLAFSYPTIGGAIVAWLAGLFLDISGGQVLGPYGAGCALTFAVSAAISQRIFIEATGSSILTVSIATIGVELVALGFSRGLLSVDRSWRFALSVAITAALTPLMFRLMRSLLGHHRSSSHPALGDLRW